MEDVSLIYLSSGCNKGPHVLDWGFNELICYATCNSIALYNPKFTCGAGRVFTSLAGHKSAVTCVRWIRKNESPEKELISTSADGTAIIWRKCDETNEFRVNHVLNGHSASVTIADAIYVESVVVNLLVATASVDSTIKIWKRLNESNEISCSQTISCGSGFAFDVKFCTLPNTNVPLLACGFDTSNVVLYVEQNAIFENMHVLHGHEDWVRCIDIVANDNYLFMATGSQDSLIRIWKMYKIQKFTVSVEAIIAGHESWVYGVNWQPKVKDKHQTLKLISASMDKTMILWSLDTTNDLWLEEARVGEIGGTTLGYFGNKFSPDGASIIAHSYQGAFHLWHLNKASLNNTETNRWLPGVTVSGHFNQVLDISWDIEGHYLLSTSLDQTTRLHAPWIREKNAVTWHELARPQIHGHDMSCLSIVSDYKFISGADEKVLRVFEAPKLFVDNLSRLSGLSADLERKKMNSCAAEGATVPALGLSNKAVFEVNETNKTEDICFRAVQLTEPPTEEMLLQNTLWPETQKLYGHGFEVFCVACNHKGTLVASACKASNPESAAIILWDTKTWVQISQLHSHTLTVTSLSFSRDDRHLLSVSRDRTWALFIEKKSETGDITFEKFTSSNKRPGSHSRIIWSCAWAPDSSVFFTGSRDKKVIAWKMIENDVELLSSMVAKESINALDVAPSFGIKSRFLVAIGQECGSISLHWLDASTRTWTLYRNLAEMNCHYLCVKRLRFSPIV
uniref:Elongator complex protein 2 n=1 Tax=Strigamia maritima TaxID=126957 RepID=T1J327_STRMM